MFGTARRLCFFIIYNGEFRMKKTFCFFIVLVVFLSIPISAQAMPDEAAHEYGFESELNIRIEAIGDRRRVYTALTDLHGLDILTVQSAEMEQAYRELTMLRRRQAVNNLFELEQVILSESERVMLRVEELGLFRVAEDEVFLRAPAADEENQINYVLHVIIVLVLCVTAFFVSNHLRGRKRREKEKIS